MVTSPVAVEPLTVWQDSPGRDAAVAAAAAAVVKEGEMLGSLLVLHSLPTTG